ncbi:MAG: ChaN family lipoprotein, partial [Verrucomicrobia bacterium]|nr:ChaN family lipoprotein [Verrucomicrobiota bacterium]
EFARQHRIPIRALNAPAAIIRAVSRGGGLALLPADQRAQLPAEVLLDDPVYERLMQLELAVHAAVDPTKLRPMFEAQAARDETMAAHIVAARTSGGEKPRTAFVVLGAGHVRYGLGTAARVRRRAPGIAERIVLMTSSGHLQETAAEQAATRPIDITHADLRSFERPPGDYLRVLPRATAAANLPPGHPPLQP